MIYMETPGRGSITEILRLIHELNDIYFEIVKSIYNADFSRAKKAFFETDKLLGKIIDFSQKHDSCLGETNRLNLGILNQLIDKTINCFEDNNPQVVVDLLLFDFSSVLNDYADQLEKVLEQEGSNL